MNDLIEEILKKGFNLELTYNKNDDCFYYTLVGFYKSGTVKLKVNGETLIATSRYNQIDEIECFDDLVSLNYSWWNISKDRFDGWKSPESKWLPYLIESNRVIESTTIIVKYN